MNNEIPQPIFEQCLEWVMQNEIAKLKAENQELKNEIEEMDEIEREAGD